MVGHEAIHVSETCENNGIICIQTNEDDSIPGRETEHDELAKRKIGMWPFQLT